MTGEAVPVLIVGAGQAGLSLSWHLTRRGIDHVLIERHSVAHEWRDGRWNHFTLVTPNWQCRLPGFDYDGDDPDGFMKRDDVVAFLQRYADSFGPPVREGVEVTSLTQRDGGGYLVQTTGGEYIAGSVVIATGGYHHPIVPALAARVPEGIRQLHSSEYRDAASLPAGGVLVVGSGQSGAQVAEDLFLDGRDVHLALGGAPRVARFYRGRDCVAWLHDMGVYDVPVDTHAGGLAKRESTNHYVTGRDGGRDIDLRRFALDGMHLYGRLTSLHGSRLAFAPTLEASLDAADAVSESIKNDIDAFIDRSGIDAPVESRTKPVWRPTVEPDSLDLEAAGITSIIWSIGYRADYRWVKVGVFDGQGHATHRRGVTAAVGLYFLGLPWLHTWGSGRFAGIARDAEYLADAIEQTALIAAARASAPA
ncbi:MSMEG_0569 family flavin-dependent oxidoreductase [Marisediminicola senii]|uniref:MSMEG_0569 family flavin-dependent oxidoreductase n=1 Tax=Marisediminicola senii TaxID=2711233 RepID=UPI0019136B87|nr:MSMEG_0569 family flavin-dependent oxidoreductase [Marisediminicola senii]